MWQNFDPAQTAILELAATSAATCPASGGFCSRLTIEQRNGVRAKHHKLHATKRKASHNALLVANLGTAAAEAAWTQAPQTRRQTST
jgi:hypothetical protein